MSFRNYLLGAALVITLTSTGCSSAMQSSGEEVYQEQATLLVENNNWMDMTLYVVRDGFRARIGSVPSMGRAKFKLSPALIGGTGEIQILADPLGSTQRHLSQPIHLSGGQQVRFKLENNIALSSFSVW